MKSFLFTVLLLVFSFQGFSQISVSGTVTDANTKDSLPGVSILLKGTTTGTVTDANGKYQLSAPKNGTLIFSYVGYKSVEEPINGRTRIDVVLIPANVGLKELVVVGYGTQKKALVTGAISSISAAKLQQKPITLTSEALQYSPGVQVINNSGSPGSAVKIRIRGFSSNNNSSPIYIVDGVKTGYIDHLDPSDIKSIEILKDAASAAIYGAEGANGVVIITTKKGTAGKMHVDYDFQFSWQSLRKEVHLLNTEQYANYMAEANLIPNVDQTYNTDWQKELFKGSAPMQKHHLSFSGGNKKSDYYVGLTYLNQDGIVVGNQDFFKRFNFTESYNVKLKKWLKIGNTILFSKTHHASINEAGGEFGGVVSDAMMIDPATPVEYKETVPSFVQDLINSGKKLIKSPDGNYYGISPYIQGEIMNPFVELAITNGMFRNDAFTGMFYATITPVKGLEITSRASLDLSYGFNHWWSPTYYYSPDKNNSQTKVFSYYDKWQTWLWENFATYKKQIKKHNFSIVVGTSAQDYTHFAMGAQGGPMINELPSYARLNYISTQANDQVNGSFDEKRLLSYYGRLTYSYADKYLFEASLRADGAGASQLPKEGRWGVFPAFSAGWVVSNENFFPKSDKGISYLKLRGSWGKNGSLSNLGGYQYASFITSTSWGHTLEYPYNNYTYGLVYEPTQLPNLSLKWEESIQTDIGLDLHAFNDHLTFTTDYYIKKTSGLITVNTPPLEAGNNAAPINAGDVVNRGLELQLGYNNSAINNKLHYYANFNFSTLHNEVTYLNPSLHMLYGQGVGVGWTATAFSEGYPVWYFFGYKTNGIDKQTGNPNFVDINGDGVINSSDKTYIGSPIPKGMYGANLGIGYKNINLSVILQGAYGNKVLMGWIRTDRPTQNYPYVFYKDRWTPQNPNGTMPKAGADPKTWNSDILVFDASYLKIQQIMLSYDLPQIWLNKAKINKVKLFVAINNFFMFTKYPGSTPLVGTNNGSNANYGIDHGTYPDPKSIMIGTHVSF